MAGFGAKPANIFGSSSSIPATTTHSLFGQEAPTFSLFGRSSTASPVQFGSSSLFGQAQLSSAAAPVPSFSTASTTTTTISSCSSGATYTGPLAVSSSNGALHSVDELPSNRVKMAEEVGNKTSEHSSCATSEFVDGYPDEFGLSPGFSKQLIPCPQKGLSVQNCHFINQILLKYGDITKGSVLKSVEARTTFLKFVAEVVALLSSNTLETIGAHEIETMKNWTDDAASVGFHVDWLQQRIKRVAANSKYRESSVRLNEISEEINAAKLALSKLEHEQ